MLTTITIISIIITTTIILLPGPREAREAQGEQQRAREGDRVDLTSVHIHIPIPIPTPIHIYIQIYIQIYIDIYIDIYIPRGRPSRSDCPLL